MASRRVQDCMVIDEHGCLSTRTGVGFAVLGNGSNGHRRLAPCAQFVFLSGKALAAGSVCLGFRDRKVGWMTSRRVQDCMVIDEHGCLSTRTGVGFAVLGNASNGHRRLLPCRSGQCVSVVVARYLMLPAASALPLSAN